MHMQSQSIRQADSAARRFASHPALYAVCRLLFRVCLLIACLGALISPTIVCGIALKAVHSFRTHFWIAAAVMSVAVLFVLLRSCRRLAHDWQRGVIEIDAVVACIAFAITATFLAVTLSTGFFFHDNHANPARALRLQSNALVGRVAELGSLAP